MELCAHDFPAGRPGRLKTPVLLLFCLFMSVSLLFGAPDTNNAVVWHKDNDTMDADIKSWNVLQLLRQIAGETGWKIYLDPGAIHAVSVKFTGKPTGDALHSMFGNLNFILVPETNSPSRLYVFRVTRTQATRLVAPPKKVAQPIPNQLVVTLKPGSKTKIEDLARALHAKIIGRMDDQNAYLLQFQDDAATQLARSELASNPDVASIDNNYPMEAPPVLSASDANSPNLQLNPATNNGCQLVVGLIDTAVQPLGNNLDQFLLPAIHVAGDVSVPADQLTHGTAMTETLAKGIAGGLNMTSSGGTTSGGSKNSTSVKILPVDVYGNSESTSTFNVAQGLVQAVNNGADIINMSLGGTGDSQILRDTVAQIVGRGIPVYAAAGNDPVTTPTYPAAYPGVVAVTATDNTGQIASYANRGSFVQIAAPGDNVVPYNGQSWLVEGTSTSTALITGTAAGLADANHDCADQAQSLLQKSLPRTDLLNQK
jgi:hypothetical protein